MYAIVNDRGVLEVHTDSADICFNCKNIYKRLGIAVYLRSLREFLCQR